MVTMLQITFLKFDIPDVRIVTYANFICDYRPLKSDKHRVRLTVGGEKLDYPDDAASPAAFLLETKLLPNSTLSDTSKGSKFLTLDIKDFFLANLYGQVSIYGNTLKILQ